MGDLATEAYATIETALATAREAQAVLVQEVERLGRHLSELNDFVRAGERLLAEALGPGVPTAAAPRTAADLAETVLMEVGHPLRVGDIAAYLDEHCLLQGKSPRDALRTAMRDHPERFRRVKRGYYGLQAWRA